MNKKNIKDDEDKEFFKNPKTLFQQRIREILKDDPGKDLFLDLVHLHLFKNSEKNNDLLNIVEIYNLIGLDKFFELMVLLGGKNVKFPTQQSFQETIQIALCFYLKQYKDKSWEEIKSLIEDDEFSSVKLGIKIQKFQKFLDYISEKCLFKYKKQFPNVTIEPLPTQPKTQPQEPSKPSLSPLINELEKELEVNLEDSDVDSEDEELEM